MDPKERNDPAKDLPKGAKPREGSQRREVERAEHHPEPHHGRQLAGAED